MGLLDKVKETAQTVGDKAKEGLAAGQEKLDTHKVEKQIGDLKAELGGIVYSQKTGTAVENADAEIERIVEAIKSAEAELKSSDSE